MKYVYILVVILFAAVAWYHLSKKPPVTYVSQNDSTNLLPKDTIKSDPILKVLAPDTLSTSKIITAKVSADSLIAFAESLIGTPYKYASIDPSQGFDCSGFITYVFNHFKISVPRSSIDFTNVGTEVPVNDAKKGDLILFTGTDSTERFVGHMGIVISSSDSALQFIHSSSGKANGVVITPLNEYYKGRFMKVIRVFDGK